MAYFPNGSAGEFFMAECCCRCLNWREREWRSEVGHGCPLYDLHILLDQYGCRARGVEPSIDPESGGLAITRFVLDYVIEWNIDDGYHCSMFVPDGRDHDTLSLFPEDKSMPEIHGKDVMLLRIAIGTAKDDDGNEYEMTQSVQGSPMIKSLKTRRTFSLSWQDILEMAVQAGIDMEPDGE